MCPFIPPFIHLSTHPSVYASIHPSFNCLLKAHSGICSHPSVLWLVLNWLTTEILQSMLFRPALPTWHVGMWCLPRRLHGALIYLPICFLVLLCRNRPQFLKLFQELKKMWVWAKKPCLCVCQLFKVEWPHKGWDRNVIYHLRGRRRACFRECVC